jgi:hypothetical protein
LSTDEVDGDGEGEVDINDLKPESSVSLSFSILPLIRCWKKPTEHPTIQEVAAVLRLSERSE